MSRRSTFGCALAAQVLALVPLRAQPVASYATIAARAPITASTIAGIGARSGMRSAARPTMTVVRVSKWALLGATVGFGVYAVRHTSRAQQQYNALVDACTTSPERCELVGGRYRDDGIERLYQQTLAQDRRARVGIVGGQASLFGSLALFIYDLRNGRGPADIPYPGGDAASEAAPLRVAAGLRLRF